MDEHYDTYDTEVEENEIYDGEIVIDCPTTALANAADAYKAICSSWNTDALRSATASLSDTFRKISDSIQPVLASSLYASAVSESMTNSMSCIAESIKPLTSAYAMEGMTTAVERLRESVAINPAVSEALQNTASASIASVAESIRDSMAIDPGITTALGSTIQNSMAEAVQPLVSSSVLEGISSIASVAREALRVGATLSENLMSSARVAVEAVQPVQTALSAWKETLSASFDMSKFFSAITIAIDFTDFFEPFRETMARMSDLMSSIWERSGCSLHGLARLLFRYLCTKWKQRPRVFLLHGHESIKQAAALVNIGLPPPKQVREFAVQIRETLLIKHQRISDDSDDLDDSFSLVFATW